MEKGYAVLSVEHKVYVIVLCVSYDVFCFTFEYLFVIDFCIKNTGFMHFDGEI